MAAGAESAYTLAIHLQTDRPVYVVGQAVRVRFIITTETPVYYELGYRPNLEIVDGEGKPVLKNSGDFDLMSGSTRPMALFPPGSTTLRAEDWRGGRVMRQWWALESLGYHLVRPGQYTMVANGNIDVYNGVKASPPVTIEVLTRAAARTRSSDVLSDPRTNAAFGKLANEYVRLRSSLIGMIALIRKRANWQDLILKYPTWSQQRDDFQNRIDELSSSGNPSSPYVQVNANLENAAAGLGAAEERAISCDAPNATVDLAAADYYLNAVRSELSTGRANIGDAADSPRFASPSGYCKVTVTPPTTCAVPNGEVKYLGGPTVTMPSGLNPSDRALVLVIVAPNGTVVRASIWKTSGNAQIDQSVLGVARRGKFSPKRADCRPVEGEYLFGAYSAAR